MIISCMLVALATLFFKYGIGLENFWYVLPYEGFGIFIGAIILLLFPRNYKLVHEFTKKLPKKVYSLMVVNEILFISARYFGFFALSLLTASMVGILAGLQPLFVLIYGIILSLWFPSILKEVINKKILTLKLVAIIFIIIGTVLLLH